MNFYSLALVSVFLYSSAHSVEGVVVYPIDKACIACGAQFDFKVEFPEILNKEDLEIKIDGKTPAAIFGVSGKLVEDAFGIPPRKATSFIARNCVIDSANDALLVEVYVRKEKVSELRWRIYSPKPAGRQAKNVILMIGDGLSQAHRTAARIMSKGIIQGKYNGMLAMEDMPHMALVGTSGMDSIITDSANSASSYTTGHKTSNGCLSVYKDRTENYDAVPSDEIDDPACETIGHFARRARGMAVGVVTDAEIQDATPAAMYAHIANRRNYLPIVEMLKDCDFNVIMGGGRASFTDEQFAHFKTHGYNVCESRTDLLNAEGAGKLFGIFNPKNIDGVWDRKFLKKFSPPEMTDQPDLTEMAAMALRILDKSPNGFVLMIEGARIDKYSHLLDWERAVMDTIMFDQTVALVKEFAAKRDDTLVLVLGDHTHGVSIVGTIEDTPPHTIDIVELEEASGRYVKKKVRKQGRDYIRAYGDAGFPSYTIKDGYPERLDVKRRLSLSFGNFPDYYETFNPKYGGEFKPTQPVATTTGEIFNVINDSYKGHPDAVLRTGNLPRGNTVPLPNGVHTAEDSIVTAMGPGSEVIRGYIDNTRIFEIMVNALNLRIERKVLPK